MIPSIPSTSYSFLELQDCVLHLRFFLNNVLPRLLEKGNRAILWITAMTPGSFNDLKVSEMLKNVRCSQLTFVSL